MGKASKWFRAVLGLKKPELPSPQNTKEKRRWSFVKSYREKDDPVVTTSNNNTTSFPTKRCVLYDDHRSTDCVVAVAEASAAVAEAAVVAAQAAAEVVRLTSSGRCVSSANTSAVYGGGGFVGWCDQDYAAIRIQAAFRGYLARRALRALRALVRLQALVRGHIQRKRFAEWLHCMHAVLQAQARARAGRTQISQSSRSSSKSSRLHHPGPSTPEKVEYVVQANSRKYEQSPILKRTPSKSSSRSVSNEDRVQSSFRWSEQQLEDRLWNQQVPFTWAGSTEEDKNDKILEVDTGRHHSLSKRRNLFDSPNRAFYFDQCSHRFTTFKASEKHMARSPFSGEVQSSSPLEFTHDSFFTAENSPQFHSATSPGRVATRSPFTPAKSDCSRSFLSGFSDYPNYMSYTESSRAKARSLSAPRQRPEYERSSSATKRQSLNICGEQRSTSAQRASSLHSNFTSKAYPGSGRLDKLGMPVGHRY